MGNSITSFLVFKSTATKYSWSRLAIRPLKRPSTSSGDDITGRPGLRTLPNRLPNSTAARTMQALASPMPCTSSRSCTEAQDRFRKDIPRPPGARFRAARARFRSGCRAPPGRHLGVGIEERVPVAFEGLERLFTSPYGSQLPLCRRACFLQFGQCLLELL